MIIISHRNPHFRCISLFSCGVFLHLIPETVTHVSICSHNLYKMTVMVLFTACYKEHCCLVGSLGNTHAHAVLSPTCTALPRWIWVLLPLWIPSYVWHIQYACGYIDWHPKMEERRGIVLGAGGWACLFPRNELSFLKNVSTNVIGFRWWQFGQSLSGDRLLNGGVRWGLRSG